MAKILIVDDEPSYRRQIEIALAADGHEVVTASGGREAIDRGARFRPAVLVADWMLRDDIHGLHVAEVLRAVVPEIRTILVTGFASDDLRSVAGKLRIADFIEKPFTVERIRGAVRMVASAPFEPPTLPPVAVLEVDEAGAILFANDWARQVLGQTDAGAEAAAMADLFPAGKAPSLDAAVDRWVAAAPRAARPVFWHIRAQPHRTHATRLVILRRHDDPQHMTNSLIDMLLGLKEIGYGRWPLEGRVLVMSDTTLGRRLAVSMLEGAGAGCYGAQTLTEAVRLVENDEGIHYVILDYDAPGPELGSAFDRLRGVRPGLIFVGSGSPDQRSAFEQSNVVRFLAKPWRTETLANLLTGRIGNCVDCGLPLPLRRPRDDDQPVSWVCTGCGARYLAVLDDSRNGDLSINVARAD